MRGCDEREGRWPSRPWQTCLTTKRQGAEGGKGGEDNKKVNTKGPYYRTHYQRGVRVDVDADVRVDVRVRVDVGVRVDVRVDVGVDVRVWVR